MKELKKYLEKKYSDENKPQNIRLKIGKTLNPIYKMVYSKKKLMAKKLALFNMIKPEVKYCLLKPKKLYSKNITKLLEEFMMLEKIFFFTLGIFWAMKILFNNNILKIIIFLILFYYFDIIKW